ncbi:hypothetical protein LTR86_005249 [Recurvomyces mirabilis]|nr:hypothetical protein LTR86_005249 [Recurvomyces mirabilis]
MAQLPEELLQHTCSYLRIECSPKSQAEDKLRLATLANFSLASKACKRSAEAHLYFALDLRNNPFARLRPFLVTLASRPSLRALVQRIHNDFFETQRDVDSGNAETEAPPADIGTQMTSLANSIPDDDLRDRITPSLAKGIQDAELALLLCSCPNLRLWETVAVNRMDQTLCMAVIRAAAPGDQATHTPPLQQLSEIRVSHWDTEGAVRMPKIQILLELPALKTFRGRMICCDETNPITSKHSSTLERLYLDESVIDEAGLKSLLPTLPHLETLSVHWASSIVGTCDLSFVALGGVLRSHGKGLINLILKTSDANVHRNASIPLGDLRPLEQLQADNDTAEALDKQITALISDSAFANLTTIKINRSDEFTMDVSDIGWDESESSRFWVTLKKIV